MPDKRRFETDFGDPIGNYSFRVEIAGTTSADTAAFEEQMTSFAGVDLAEYVEVPSAREPAADADPLPVLMVIADQQDFWY